MTTRDLSIMFARFPYGRQEDCDIADWLVSAVMAAKAHPRIKEIYRFRTIDTPIPMLRNRALNTAREKNVDFLVMVDSDMSCDAYLESNPYRLGLVPSAKPFLESSLDFAISHRERLGPCVVGAPYCGPPPFENVYVFRWSTAQTSHPNADLRLEGYSREEAITLSGIQEVDALPTGLILIDMQALPKMDPPYTYYEWTDERELQKASTEDVTLTRDMGLLGIPQYCNWDAWCGHWKWKCVGRPAPITTRMVSEKFRRALKRELNIGDGEQLIFVTPRRQEKQYGPQTDKAGHSADRVSAGCAGNGNTSGTHQPGAEVTR